VPGKENGGATHQVKGKPTRWQKWASTVVFPIGGGDLLQHESRSKKVRCGPFEEEKVVQRELTEGGGWWRCVAQF
jgi:hypothetical protein